MTPYSAPAVVPRPPPVPIAESDNPDVIALRSALALLQLQRQTGRRDMQTLVRLKGDAERDPRGVAEELVKRKAGQAGQGREEGDLLGPTLRNYIEAAVEDGKKKAEGGESEGKAATAGADRDIVMGQSKEEQGKAVDDSDSEAEDSEKQFKYPQWPAPQNVYRMPPINWAKYQVVGPSLDKLHDEQVRRPVLGQPYQDTEERRGEPYVMAAPYEGIGEYDFSRGDAIHPMQTRKGTRKTN
jgi:hypothetical protein